MSRRSRARKWLSACFAVAVLAALAVAVPRLLVSPAALPAIHYSHTNVLMLTLCTLRADHLGCYGYDRDVSPNLDKLAAQGFRFERVLSQAPWTRSGVSAIITGMYPRSLNIEDPENQENYRRLHDDFTTTAEIMRQNGYHTIGITANPNTHSIFNFHQGYDYYRDPPVLWQDGYRDEGVWTSIDVNRMLLDHLEGEGRGRKFFAHLVYIDVHVPREHKVETEQGDNFTVPPKGQRKMKDVYDLHVSFLDENVGNLFATLEERGLRGDTLVIINADHGEGLKEARWLDEGHSRHVYNSTIWIPWIVYHPALPANGGSRAEVVCQIDILPTLLDMLGLDTAPAVQPPSTLAGSSRWPDLRRSGKTPEVNFGFVRTQFLGADKAAVVTPEHKLIFNFDHAKKVEWRKPNKKKDNYYFPPEFELYRYRENPGELDEDNLYESDPQLAEQLKAEFVHWEAAFPPLVPDEQVRVPKDQTHDLDRRLRELGYVSDEPVADADSDDVDDPSFDGENDNGQDTPKPGA